MTSSHEPLTSGAHHVGLTVPDLPATRAFFEATLGFEAVGEVPAYPAVFLTDGTGMITLWQARDGDGAVPFDRHANVGLHHLAIRVADPGRLEELHRRLGEAPDVTIEFAPEPLGEGPTRHMMTVIPGGIRVEFIAPVSA